VGIILDSSVIIAAERRGQSVRQILEQVQTSQGETEVGLSVVTVAELLHGSYRTRRKRLQSDAWSLSSDCAEMCPYIPRRSTSHGR
jgi:predicted nucleic acid-binding protein